MATCGYVCPSCEGSGYNDEGGDCTWCSDIIKTNREVRQEKDAEKENELENWIKNVHEGPCCGD